jgi:hypothetical protein
MREGGREAPIGPLPTLPWKRLLRNCFNFVQLFDCGAECSSSTAARADSALKSGAAPTPTPTIFTARARGQSRAASR